MLETPSYLWSVQSLTIFSCNSLTSYSQFMNASEGSAAGLLDVIGMIV